MTEDDRGGFHDKAGAWHTGLPVPNWADFLSDAGLDPRSILAALTVLGVQADWSCARRYRSGPGNQGRLIPHEPVVYYIDCLSGLVKIGTTTHLRSRWVTYAKRPDPPRTLRTLEHGSYEVERAAIRHFQTLRTAARSEYLQPSPELDAWIAERAAWLHTGPGH